MPGLVLPGVSRPDRCPASPRSKASPRKTSQARGILQGAHSVGCGQIGDSVLRRLDREASRRSVTGRTESRNQLGTTRYTPRRSRGLSGFASDRSLRHQSVRATRSQLALGQYGRRSLKSADHTGTAAPGRSSGYAHLRPLSKMIAKLSVETLRASGCLKVIRARGGPWPRTPGRHRQQCFIDG